MKSSAYLPGPERRRTILEAAKVLFARHGYHHTNIENICERLGISRGTVYLYFSNRQDVFMGILEHLLERLQAAKRRAPAAAKTRKRPTEILAQATAELERTLGALFEDETSARILLRVAPGVHPDVDGLLRRIDDLAVDRLTKLLDDAQRNGRLRLAVEARKIAQFTLGGAHRLVLEALGRRSKSLDLGATAAEATKISFGMAVSVTRP
jgi:AcrR family transcriptional regulator